MLVNWDKRSEGTTLRSRS